MKNRVAALLVCAALLCCASLPALAQAPGASLTLIGHSSVKIVTASGAVVYLDPSFPGDYSEPADLILVSHEHGDHNQVDLIRQKEGCLTVRVQNAVNKDGTYNNFEHAGITVEPFPAENKFHPRRMSCGFLLSFDGLLVYFAGDTSKIPEMETLTQRGVDYALLPIDGEFNMGAQEAMECAALIAARHTIPMHFFDADPAEFQPENLLFVPYGGTVELGGK